MDQNSRLPYHTIFVTYLDYILLPLVCGNCPINSKTVGCWNLLESSPDRIPSIESIHNWNQILLTILNSKIGIRIFSQPTIDANSQ